MSHAAPDRRRASPLAAILWLTFLASLGTGVLWSGVSFVAKHDYGYSQELNFILFIFTAAVYIVAAFASGPITRLLRNHLAPRSIIGLLLLGQIIASTSLVVWEGHVALWTVAAATSILAALLWPIVESYIAAGRHGAQMRSAIGWWNISWTSAVAVALIGMAPLLDEQNAYLAIVALAPASFLAMLALPWFTKRPGEHDEVQWKASITDEYPFLLRSARVLLPVSYIVLGAISPLLPYRLEELEVARMTETPTAATWMVVRVAAIALMWRLTFWHGRWGTLLAGGTGLVGGFAMVVLSTNLPVLMLGLALVGTGQGIIYYTALYYAMAVGRAEVEAGGVHEALIGLGYGVGPLASLIGLRLPTLPGVAAAGAGGIVTAVVAILAIAAVPAVTPYRRARRMRAQKVKPLMDTDTR